ncbi:lipopolysaccharide biosynthesis protein [Pontibacter locisalis]|uniref:Lipopolysaccharide biosynthesis protein n=1 Tax=Pontibacter locisalis TaxID=1719035 RepID=A0ABW5IKZ1_9BACT
MIISSINSYSERYLRSGRIKQILTLFSVTLASIPIGIVTSVVLTGFLGSKLYGDYQFLNSLFLFAVVIFSTGFFQAANRALVLNEDKQKNREYYGATLVILLMLFLVMAAFLIIYSYLDVNIKSKGLNNLLLLLIPFGWLYLLINYFEVLFQADNKIGLLSISRLLPKVGFLTSSFIIYYFFINIEKYKLELVWFFFIITQIIVYFYIIKKLKVSFKNFKHRVNELWNLNKSFGLHIYLGSVFGVGIAQLTGIIISYYSHDNSGVGYFALAFTFCSPLQFIPNTIATTHYKDFASQSVIPNKLIYFTLFLTFISLILSWILVPIFINYYYGKEFEPVIQLNFVLSISIALYGIADFYNRFLGAHGKGKQIRNSSFIVGFIVLLASLILIPQFGAQGAVYSRLAGGCIYISCMLFYYKKSHKII